MCFGRIYDDITDFLFSECMRNIAANIRLLWFELGNKDHLKIKHLHVIETYNSSSKKKYY